MTLLPWSTFAKKVPTRLGIALMLFMACMVSYMLRVNLSLNIIAMVDHQDDNEPCYGPRYPWTASEQSLLLGAYFWGYLITSLPGGLLAERFGGTFVGSISLIGSAVLNALIPLAASWNIWMLYVLRFLIGFFGGVLYPVLHNLISKWAPPDEKGKFVSSLMGGTFGTVITWPLCGAITEAIGWNWAFYITSLFSGAVGAVWVFIVSDNPAIHKFIGKDEREYIENSLAAHLSTAKSWPPYKKLLQSLPFYGLLILHYGNMWGLFFLLTAAPKFMNEVLGFQLTEAGFLASLPYLFRLIMAFVFGAIGDVILRKKVMSTTAIRKTFTLCSHVIPGIFLIVLALLGKNQTTCVIIITLSLGFNGAATITNLMNSQDLAPNYAGTIYGIINFVGTTPGFFSPIVVAFITGGEKTMEAWVNVFIIGAIAYIAPAIIFWLFGSGNVQPWNSIEPKSNPEAPNTTTRSGDISPTANTNL